MRWKRWMSSDVWDLARPADGYDEWLGCFRDGEPLYWNARVGRAGLLLAAMLAGPPPWGQGE